MGVSPSYHKWTTYSRNLEADYKAEYGINPYLVEDIRIGHFVHDSWVGDKGGTVRNLTFARTIDTTPPTTAISFSPASPNGENGWYVSNVAATLSAADPGGIQRIEYKIGSGWVTYTGPFTISQEGITTIQYRSIDNAGNVEPTRSASVNLDKTPPTSIPGGPYSGNEGSSVSFDGSGSSDAVSGVQSHRWEFSPAVSGQTSPQNSALAPYAWGDNGEFEAALTVKDLAGWEGGASVPVSIANVLPTLVLDRDGLVTLFGGEAKLTKINATTGFAAEGSDQGSDDLIASFSFGDGVAEEETSLNDSLVGPDPFPSPAINPRSASFSRPHQYSSPNLYSFSLSLTDDDGGTTSDGYPVIATGSQTEIRTVGFWKNQYLQQVGGGVIYSPDYLNGFWEIAKFISRVYDETSAPQTLAEIAGILSGDEPGNSMLDRAKSQCLATALNFASGSIGWGDQVDTDYDTVPDTAFSQALIQAEETIASSSSTDPELEQAKDACDSVNNMEVIARSGLGSGLSLAWLLFAPALLVMIRTLPRILIRFI